jgi:hypothetical protein
MLSNDGNLIEFDIDDEALNKIEELLLEAAIHDPIGFRVWHKDFKSYVEQKFFERAEESRKAIEKARNKRN